MSTLSLHSKNLDCCFIFFDEIQYYKNWEQHLKILEDAYPNTKFIVSGSAAAALKLQSAESGAGRFTDFMLPPLTIQEYLHLSGKHLFMRPGIIHYGGKALDYLLPVNMDLLNDEFERYLNFGGTSSLNFWAQYFCIVFSSAVI